MSHREDLLAGAVRCLREKGYAHTTARDIVAASGTNLASIGYHYGSTKALLNAAVIQALDEFGAQMAQAIGTDAAAGVTAAERLERFWARVIDSFQTSREVWLATFDIFTVAQRDPEVRAAVAAGIDDARIFWAQTLYGVDPADERRARAIGSLHQALVSGVMVQWLIDPERAPTPADLAQALPAIAAQVIATKPTATKPTATKSTATEPTAIEPTATKPTATKSTATEPAATKPTATKPTATEPG